MDPTSKTNSKPNSESDSQNDMPPPAYSETQPVATTSGFGFGPSSTSASAPTPTPTPPLLDPYNPYNPFNNPWQSTSSTPSTSVLGSASSPRQPLLHSTSSHQYQPQTGPTYSDMPHFPNDGAGTTRANGPPGSNPWSNELGNIFGPGTNGVGVGVGAGIGAGIGAGGAFGPTPTQHLHNQGIPYAYYDPRSEHSIVQADARARKRFIGAIAWVFMIGFLVVLMVRGYYDGYFDDLGGRIPRPGWPGGGVGV